MANVTVTQKVPEAGHRRFWEAKQMLGKDRFGQPITREVFVDVRSTEGGREPAIYSYPDGWNAKLPDLPSGDPGKQACYQPPSQKYREQYEKVDWSK